MHDVFFKLMTHLTGVFCTHIHTDTMITLLMYVKSGYMLTFLAPHTQHIVSNESGMCTYGAIYAVFTK